MSIDPVRTLDPALGLVSESGVYVPNEVGLWRTAGVLAHGRASQAGFASAVGAFDVRKRDSITRGAGEAVERFALAPAAADSEHLIAGAGSVDLRIDFITPGLGRPSALAYEFPWYRATNLLTAKATHVPAPVVDYCPGHTDANPWDGFFDPSPNGAASGPSEDLPRLRGSGKSLNGTRSWPHGTSGRPCSASMWRLCPTLCAPPRRLGASSCSSTRRGLPASNRCWRSSRSRAARW